MKIAFSFRIAESRCKESHYPKHKLSHISFIKEHKGWCYHWKNDNVPSEDIATGKKLASKQTKKKTSITRSVSLDQCSQKILSFHNINLLSLHPPPLSFESKIALLFCLTLLPTDYIFSANSTIPSRWPQCIMHFFTLFY